MSTEGESDDSTIIRRKILLSPTMPPQDSMGYDPSPLANLIGRVRLQSLRHHPYLDPFYPTVSRA